MKSFSEQFNTEANKVKLTAAERNKLRAQVLSYIEYHPLPGQAQIADKKPAAKTVLQDSFVRVNLPWLSFVKFGSIAAALVLVVVPFVAERAVPGDTLYAIKVNFNEEVRSSLTWDSYQKVEWETERLNRRLAEARLLANEGRLTEEVEAEVAAAVKQYTHNAKAEIAALSETDAEAATIATIALDSTLEIQASTLAARSASSTDSLATTLSSVRGVPATMSSTTLPTFDKLMARVEQSTTRVYEQLATLQRRPDTPGLADITRRSDDIARTVESAIALQASDEQAARQLLVEVLQRTQKLSVYMADIAVRESVDVESVVPVVLTTDEQTVRIEQLKQDVAKQLSELDTLLGRVSDRDVIEKTELATTQVNQIVAELDNQATFAAKQAQLLQALELTKDTRMVIESSTKAQVGATSTVPVATSTASGTATATVTDALEE